VYLCYITNTNCEDSSLKIDAEDLNDYFLKIAKNISDNINSNTSSNKNSTSYSPFKLSQIFNLQYSEILFHDTTSGEIENIIKNFPGKMRAVMMRYP
jgi:hypothetical protein